MIINPSDTDHTLKVVPRFYPCNHIKVIIKDTTTGIELTEPSKYRKIGNKLSFDFSLTCIEETRYQITLSDNDTNEVIYRGIMIATNQDTQEYQLTKDKFYY